MWRTVGRSTQPPTPIGSFEGTLTEAELVPIVQAAQSLGESNGSESPPADTVVDTILARGQTLRVGADAEAADSWLPLVSQLRHLLLSLTDRPRAAIGIVIGRAESSDAALFRFGPETLAIDLSRAEVRTTAWRNGQIEDQRTSDEDLGGSIETTSDWRLELPIPAELLQPGRQLTVSVDFDIRDREGKWRRAGLWSDPVDA